MTLMIDDVQAALTILADVGRQMIGPAALSVRGTIIEVGHSIGWQHLEYNEFREWVIQQRADLPPLVVLDPLIRRSPDLGPPVPLVLRRVSTENGLVVRESEAGRDIANSVTGDVTLVDDVAASGATLEFAVRLLSQRGAKVVAIVLCAGTDAAKKRLVSLAPGIVWRTYVHGTHMAIHVRDACPYVPHSGRPIQGHSDIATSNGVIQVRRSSIESEYGPWVRLFRDYRVRTAAVQARLTVARAFSAYLKRDALVADVPTLGTEVAVPLYSNQRAVETTTLLQIANGHSESAR